MKVLLQSSYVQVNGRSLLWERRCSSRRHGRLNVLLQPSWVQWYVGRRGCFFFAGTGEGGVSAVAASSPAVELLSLGLFEEVEAASDSWVVGSVDSVSDVSGQHTAVLLTLTLLLSLRLCWAGRAGSSLAHCQSSCHGS